MSTFSSTLTRPQSPVGGSQPLNDSSMASTYANRLIERMKSLYQADQQAKFLNLQAEVDSLLEQLQILKQQREGSVNPEFSGHLRE